MRLNLGCGGISNWTSEDKEKSMNLNNVELQFVGIYDKDKLILTVIFIPHGYFFTFKYCTKAVLGTLMYK